MEKNSKPINPIEATTTSSQCIEQGRVCVLEVCCGSLTSVQHAAEGGAARVELCSGLDEGGLTPSIGLIRAAMQVEGPKKHVLIRPRGGDFLYTPAEQDIIVDDILAARRAGVDGVVVGALTADGDVDIEACRRFVQAACEPYALHEGATKSCAADDAADSDRELLPPLCVTFHRAFDLCRNPHAALQTIIELGFHRVLTSGQAPTAEAGIALLRTLVDEAAGRIIIMPGCGVTPANAAHIVESTGASEIHASARAPFPSQMRFRHPGVSMGKPGSDEYATKETDVLSVKTIVSAIAGLA